MSASETDLVTGLEASRSFLAELLAQHQPRPFKLIFDLESENADSVSAALINLDEYAVHLGLSLAVW